MTTIISCVDRVCAHQLFPCQRYNHVSWRLSNDTWRIYTSPWW